MTKKHYKNHFLARKTNKYPSILKSITKFEVCGEKQRQERYIYKSNFTQFPKTFDVIIKNNIKTCCLSEKHRIFNFSPPLYKKKIKISISNFKFQNSKKKK